MAEFTFEDAVEKYSAVRQRYAKGFLLEGGLPENFEGCEWFWADDAWCRTNHNGVTMRITSRGVRLDG